jgi:hypothetical protein
LEDLGIDGKITAKWFFEKWDEEAWTGLLCLRGRWWGLVNMVINRWLQ